MLPIQVLLWFASVMFSLSSLAFVLASFFAQVLAVTLDQASQVKGVSYDYIIVGGRKILRKEESFYWWVRSRWNCWTCTSQPFDGKSQGHSSCDRSRVKVRNQSSKWFSLSIWYRYPWSPAMKEWPQCKFHSSDLLWHLVRSMIFTRHYCWLIFV